MVFISTTRDLFCVNNSEGQIATERLKRAKEIELVVEGMRERERRAYMRRIEREQASELIDAGSDLEIDNDELSD